VTPDEALQVFTDTKRAYQLAFRAVGGESVLVDLAPFCRANETCVVLGDRDRTYVLEGRREVWLRIQDYLKLTPEELVNKYTKTVQGVLTDVDSE
jgi:hypothetical protein